MNLLGPVAPVGWSSLVPELPLASEFQSFEGFQYLGAGVLALLLLAVLLTLRQPARQWRSIVPVAACCLVLAAYALSPRVTMGSSGTDRHEQSGSRPAGRLSCDRPVFWPAAYALVAFIIWAVVTRLRPAAAVAVLAAGIGLQVIDLAGHYQTLRTTAHSDAFHSWPQPLQSPLWRAALPHYRRLLMYPPEQCGPAAMPFSQPAFLAGSYGMSINTGNPARVDHAARRGYCQQLGRDWERGVVSDDAIYLLHLSWVDQFRSAAQQPVVCTEIDRISACVTEASYAEWRPDARH